MSRVIAIANQKGGVGKTTTTLTLGAALVERGRSVLLVDLDPQSSLTIALGIDGEHGNLHQDIALSRSEAGLMVRLGRESVLKKALQDVHFDYVLIDCLPSLGILTINALVAAEEVIIPTACEYLALRGIALFYQTLHEVQSINAELRVLGILPTFYDGRLVHARDVLQAMKERGLPVFDLEVGRSVRFAEASLSGESILTYARDNPGAEAYRRLAEIVDQP